MQTFADSTIFLFTSQVAKLREMPHSLNPSAPIPSLEKKGNSLKLLNQPETFPSLSVLPLRGLQLEICHPGKQKKQQ